MNADVQRKLRDVFAAVLGAEAAELGDHDSQETVEAWDSVNHMQLMLAIEDAFGTQFSPDEFASLTSFGALRQKLEGDQTRTAR